MRQASIATAQRVAEAAMHIPGVVAVSLGGSLASGLADGQSDIDLHVFWRAPLPATAERAAALAGVADAESGVREVLDWGLEDHLDVGGVLVELVYVELGELRAEIERAYGEGLPGEGYTTAFFASVAGGVPLADPAGELAGLRERLSTYPEPTRQRVLASHPRLLRAYVGQLDKAHARGDWLFVQHRRYTLQMVFFNMLFALNRRYHPGEKRLLDHAELCRLKPAVMAERWRRAALLPANDGALPGLLHELSDDLCALAGASL